MKAHITLRSTLSNASWGQRGTAALLLAAIMLTLALAVRPTIHATPSAPAARQAASAPRNPNLPITGTGSAYDGGSYVTKRPAAYNPNSPITGTGSAYDGGSYVTKRTTAYNSNSPIVGTGSAYVGQ